MYSRRRILVDGGLAALGATGLLACSEQRGGRIEASTSAGPQRRLVLVFASGGWDPTRTVLPAFGHPVAQMEKGASAWSTAGLSLVDHPDRPDVRAFFEAWGSELAVVNGLQIPGITHFVCTRLALTGRPSGRDPDWAARIAAAGGDDFPLPYLVVGGTGFPGPYGSKMARVGNGGLLPGLITGELTARGDLPPGRLDTPVRAEVDVYLERRAEALAQAARTSLGRERSLALQESLERIAWVQEQGDPTALSLDSGSFDDQVRVALHALSTGLSRCVALHHDTSTLDFMWDSHVNNDAEQSGLWNSLCLGLDGLMGGLRQQVGPGGALLSEDTVVVVLSEMGRMPHMNDNQGKDHWPWTSVLLSGPGIAGGRMVGGVDDDFNGRTMDLSTGALDEGDFVTIGNLGATLAVVAGQDPGDLDIPEAPIEALFA